MFSEIEKKNKPEVFKVKINLDNELYIIPQQDKISLIFGVNFNQRTDMALAKVFCQELEDTKRHVSSSVESRYYPDYSKMPIELKDIELNPKRFSNGFVSFSK
jgi:hypothetical protein